MGILIKNVKQDKIHQTHTQHRPPLQGKALVPRWNILCSSLTIYSTLQHPCIRHVWWQYKASATGICSNVRQIQGGLCRSISIHHSIYIVSDSIVIVAYLVCRRYCNRCVAVSVICVSPFLRVAVLTSYLLNSSSSSGEPCNLAHM